MAKYGYGRTVGIVLSVVALLAVQMPAHADVVDAEQFLNVMDRRAALARIDAVLALSEVQQALKKHGVDPALAEQRVAALNDQELILLAENLEQLPAGGSVLATVGIVFIVLLVLELVGAIDLFKKI